MYPSDYKERHEEDHSPFGTGDPPKNKVTPPSKDFRTYTPPRRQQDIDYNHDDWFNWVEP